MGLFGTRKKQNQTVNHKYNLGMHMVVGHANMDAVDRIRVGEKTVWTPSLPHPDNVLKDSYNTGDASEIDVSSANYIAQTWTPAAQGYYTSSVRLRIFRNSSHSSPTTISINGVDEIGEPDDSNVIVTSNEVAASSITTSTPGTWVEFILTNPVYITAGIMYAIVLKPQGPTTKVWWRYDSSDSYSGGKLYRNTGSWGAFPPGDAMFEMYLAEGNAPNHSIRIEARNIFGGSRKEGGIKGNVDLLFGASDQAQNKYLASELDTNIPAFRGSTSIVLKQVYLGTSPYLKPWAFFCRRLLKQVSGDDQWYVGKAVINPGISTGDDLNAIHIIRECLLDIEWGLGFSGSDIDSTSFERAADILHDESFGLSLLWDQTEAIEDFVGSILGTIAGFLYQDLATGKWVITLTRDPDLPRINESTEYPGLIPSGNPTIISFQSGVDPEEKQRGQTFTPVDTFSTQRVSLKLGSDDTVSVRVEIQSTTAGLPSGNVMASGSVNGSDMLPVDDLLTDTLGWITATLDREIVLTEGTQYAILFYITTPGVSTSINFEISTYDSDTGPPYGYIGGTYVRSDNFGVSWSIPSSGRSDLFFRILSTAPESFDENHIIAIEEFARPSYGEVINQVTVNWWDKINSKSRPAMAQDIALIEKQSNNIIELNLNHYGVCNAALANKIAERELKLASSMLASMRIRCTRQMSHLKPNDVFKLSWAELGIVQMIVRVIDVDYGSLQKSEVYMTCLEDAFSTAETVYENPPESEWSDPVNDALNIANIDIIETPYWILVNDIENQSVVDTTYPDVSGFLLLAVAPPTLDSLDFEIFLQQSAGLPFNSEGIAAFALNATLTIGMFEEAQNVTIDIENEFGLDLVSDDSYAVIGNEMVKVVSVDSDNDQITVERGVFDTVPEAHALGDFVYFIGDGYVNIEAEYTDGDQPAFKILPRTGNGQLLESSASTQNADILDSRFIRPYPPGNLKFNAESYPTYLSTKITGGFEITWSHRDRTDATQVGTIVLHTDATDYGPEAGTTYTIKIYDEDDNLARTVTSISGTVYEYTEAFEISDNGALQKQLRFEIYSVRDGFDSWLFGYDILIKRTLVSTAAASSSASGSLSNLVSLVGSVSATSNVSAPGLNEVWLEGVSVTTSSVTGILAGFVGSVSASSGATGELTV
jgi:hypothetical protein